MAVRYKADPDKLADALRERDLVPREQKRLGTFVVTGRWGQSSALALNRHD